MRSARIASSTPGYCTLTATSLPVVCSRAVHLPDRRRRDRNRIPRREDARRARRRARRGRPRAQSSGAIGGASCCKRCERGLHRLGHAVVEVARHLPELHRARPSSRRASRPLARWCAAGARRRARRARSARRQRAPGPVRGVARRPSARRRPRAGRCGTRRPSPRPARAGPRRSHHGRRWPRPAAAAAVARGDESASSGASGDLRESGVPMAGTGPFP